MNIRRFYHSKLAVISLCLILSLIILYNDTLVRSAANSPTPENPSLSYTEWTPIYIDGNPDFQDQASSNNWDLGGTRTGTEALPYVISNYRIIGSPTDHLIEIRNTDRYFEISNCLLIGGEYGIFLEHMSHGIIKENNITGSGSDGIYGYGINTTRIDWNYISNSSNCGIYFEYATYNIIFANTIFNNTRGIRLLYSNYNQFYRNDLYNSLFDGISIMVSEYLDIVNNTVFNCNDGIINAGSDNNEIVANKVYDNKDTGIMVVGSSNISVRGNNIYNNSFGIHLLNSDDNICSYNTINNNTVAITLDSSDKNKILINIMNNSIEGIRAEFSEENLISCNNITYSTMYGVNLEVGSTLNSVTYNNFIRNAVLESSQARDSGIKNTFRNNYWDDWIWNAGHYEIDGTSDNVDPDPYLDPIDIYEKCEEIAAGPVPGYSYLLFFFIIPILLTLIAVKKQIKR